MNDDQMRDALADALDRERHTGPLIPLLAEVADALITAAADSRSLTNLHFQAGNVANGYHQQNRTPKILNLANRVITAGQLLAAQHAAIAARHDDPDEAYRDALDERDADRLADWNS